MTESEKVTLACAAISAHTTHDVCIAPLGIRLDVRRDSLAALLSWAARNPAEAAHLACRIRDAGGRS